MSARVGKITAFTLVLAGLVWQGTRPPPALVDPSAGDYEAYWMAARLLPPARRATPYDLDAVAALQGVPPLQNGSVKVAWDPPGGSGVDASFRARGISVEPHALVSPSWWLSSRA